MNYCIFILTNNYIMLLTIYISLFIHYVTLNKKVNNCIYKPSIRSNEFHNISFKMYVCAQGVIQLMY